MSAEHTTAAHGPCPAPRLGSPKLISSIGPLHIRIAALHVPGGPHRRPRMRPCTPATLAALEVTQMERIPTESIQARCECAGMQAQTLKHFSGFPGKRSGPAHGARGMPIPFGNHNSPDPPSPFFEKGDHPLGTSTERCKPDEQRPRQGQSSRHQQLQLVFHNQLATKLLNSTGHKPDRRPPPRKIKTKQVTKTKCSLDARVIKFRRRTPRLQCIQHPVEIKLNQVSSQHRPSVCPPAQVLK
jgi:hypothetical protein